MTEPIALGFRPSPQQLRAWRLQQDRATSGSVLCALRIEGELDRRALRRALAATVARHEILRTAFRLPAGVSIPLQVILEPGPVSLPEVDLRDLPPAHRSAGATDLLGDLGGPPFRLDLGEGWRAALVRLGPREHEMLLALSAACADPGTFEPLAADLLADYARQVAGGEDDPEPPLQYADVAEWQNSLLEGEDAAEGIEIWRNHWSEQDVEARLSLPLPLQESEVAPGPFAPRETAVPLDRAAAGALARLAADWGCPPQVLLLTAWKAVIQRGTGRDETLVGVLYPGRDAEELRGVVGPLARYLPIAVRLSPEAPLREAVAQVRQALKKAESWGEYFSWDQVARNGQGDGGFPVCFEPGMKDWTLAVDGLRAAPVRRSGSGAVLDRFSLSLAWTGEGEDLRLAVRYDPRRFRGEAARRLAGRLAALLGSVLARPEAPLGDHPALAEDELSRLLELSVAPPAAGRGRDGKTLAAVFEDQADRSPNRLAVVAHDRRLTFRELDEQANRLAHHLRAAGAGPEVPVALCLERSAEAVVAILAVWKAGASYVPLDPNQPADRLAWILADTGAPLLVTDSRLAPRLPELPGVRTVRLDEDAAAIALRPADRPTGRALPRSLAYTIYTSGSTGRPKGVQVEHRSALHLLAALEAAVLDPLAESGQRPDPLLASLNAPVIFDASVQQLVQLLAGHALCVVPEDIRADGAALLAFLREQGVDLLDCTPSQLRLLVDAGLLDGPGGPRIVLTAGEAVDEPLWKRLAQAERTVCFNLYGPTECSVDATCHRIERIERIEPGSTKPTIGRPLAGYEVFVFDRGLQPVPLGAPGELCLGGDGLARGYLRRPDLTAERFVPHPFAQRPGERLYRTGDLGRHLPDGNLEFLGRLDHQVKIRGFRIELGEIETVLGEQPGARAAVVVAREDRLIAYVAGDSAVVSEGALRQALRQRLPDYMVPAAFVILAALPLTPNGKVDRKALPAPEQIGARTAYVAPRTREEEILAEVWAQALRRPQVGVDDNFFELGGDSILSVQIVARARQAGLLFTVRQIFQHQTVAELALHVTAADRAGAPRPGQGPVSGQVPLTPIQRLFFAQRADPHHFNQAVLLEAREPLSPAALELALAALVEHHDALRLRFHAEGGAWRQENAAAEPVTPFHRVDLSGLRAPRCREAYEELAAALQAGFDLSAGPLARLCLIDAGGERPARLLWVAHHLVVDGVSWRVLLEDLEGAYREAERGQRPAFPPKTTSFQEWAQRLAQHALDPALESELPWWRQEAEAPSSVLPLDHPDGENTEASVRRVSISLDADETRALLQEVPAVYRTQINDVLLTALARALAGPGRALLVQLEGHGREEIFDEVDLSRTVGWFTSLFPVRLEAGPAGDPAAALQTVKEHLRAIPRRGIGHGLLRWLREDAATAELRSTPEPAVTFNYLGQFDGMVSGSSLFAMAGESTGPARSPRQRQREALTVDALVAGGRLRADWTYSAHLHERSTVEVWAEEFLARLRELIAVCREAADRRTAGYTPSDFPLAGLGRRELDRLLGTEWGIEDVYPLSPLQEGILFHSLFESSSGAYVGQLLCTLRGDHDPRLLETACQRVVDHHPLLRTSFHWQGLERPLQVVHGEAVAALEQEDWRGLPASEQERRLEDLLRADRAQGLDLAHAPVMRWRLLRTADNESRLLWTHHHVLLDGWSFSLLVGEFLACCEALRTGDAGGVPDLPRRRPYGDYIAWLQNQDQTAAEEYWRRTLAGWTEPTPLAGDRRNGGARGTERRERWLGAAATAALEARARGWQVTLNTLVQAAWALLLARSSGRPEVVFGATVAGRPADLPGVESMVGLFINTLPVRVAVEAATELASWVRGLQLQQAELRQHEHSPLVKVQEWSGVPRGVPLFESILVFENYPRDRSMGQGGSGLGVTGVRTVEQTHYPLTLVTGPGEDLLLHIAFDRSRFDAVTIERLLGHLGTLLEGLAAAPEIRPAELPLLTAAERHQALADWNDTAAGETDARLHELFEAWAARTPSAPAVLFEGALLSYGELETLANRLARRLQALGVGAESRVGLCVQRSPEALAAMLGVLKAGGAYVPLDPESPRERLAGIAADAGISLLLTQERLAPSLAGLADRLVAVDDPAERLAEESPERPVCPALPDNAAYVIYTSGSTGAAKGVVATHRSVAHFTRAFARTIGLGPDDRLLLFAPLSFDASVLQIFPLLASGAAVVVHPDPRELASHEILALCERTGMTVLDLPAALWRQWVEDVAAQRLPLPASLRCFLTGGESVSVARLRAWAGLAERPLSFLSSYGPTEATVTSTVFTTGNHQVASLAGEKIPIGRPLPGTQAHVLDRALQPAPCGVPGELFVGGAGLTRGYLGRPDLTADAFRPDPFAAAPGGRLYRTGDLAVRLPDGALEFLGRADHQVKLRGFRVELGEIEAALLRHPAVREAAVVVREDRPGDPRLAAYAVPREGHSPAPAELRAALIERLPGYMVPATVTVLPELPVLPSGKLDRAALPAPAALEAEEHVAPRTPVEQVVAGIWAEVLGVERVGAFDSFFELGGHSLSATRVVSRLREELEAELELRRLFDAPTVAGLAEALLADPGQRARVERAAELTIQLSGLSEEQIEAMFATGSPVPREGDVA